MTTNQTTADNNSTQDSFRWPFSAIAQACDDFQHQDKSCSSQRQFAQQFGIPRSTLGYHLRRRSAHVAPDDLDPEVVALLRSPCGVALLHRLVHAAMLAFSLSGSSGIRAIGHFLELAGLDAFVATSASALWPLARSLEQLLAQFADDERARLAKDAPRRRIAVCADENFHGRRTCLVALEPCSNFLLVEAHRDRRDAGTWTEVITQSLQGLNAEVDLICSDRAGGLTKCAADGLRVIHSSDLFHHQHELLASVLLPLVRPINKAQQDLRAAGEEIQKRQAQLQQPPEKPRRGRRVDPFDRIVNAVKEQRCAKFELERSNEHLEAAMASVRGLGDDYHPFDRQTGAVLTGEEVGKRLEGHLDNLAAEVEKAELTETAKQGVQKTRANLGLLTACVCWFWTAVETQLLELQIDELQRKRVKEKLVAGYYWRANAKNARDPEQRRRLKALGQSLLDAGWAEEGPLGELKEEQRKEVNKVAQQCAGKFVRSSSAVEGRNGRLSLMHHSKGRLSQERLKALTAIHNYVSRREDGTTAAERFFGKKQRDVFPWLLERLPQLPRPARKRRNNAGQTKCLAA